MKTNQGELNWNRKGRKDRTDSQERKLGWRVWVLGLGTFLEESFGPHFEFDKCLPICLASGSLLCQTSQSGRLAESIIRQDSTLSRPNSIQGLTGEFIFSKTSRKSSCFICSTRNLRRQANTYKSSYSNRTDIQPNIQIRITYCLDFQQYFPIDCLLKYK